jgi:hypothetical protein
MRTIFKLIIALLLFLTVTGPESAQATLVHNTLQEIDAGMGKLELQLIRTWGGEHEEDEHKFFNTPRHMVIDNENLVFICDNFKHCVKVFDETGKYLRTIGRRGRGPGDLWYPTNLAFHPQSGLWVNELQGMRIQCLDTNGKSKAIFKTEHFVSWIGVNSKNEIAIHTKRESLESKRLLTVRSETWELKRKIGVYHSKSKNRLTAESVGFSIDSGDNFIAANVKTPVIRKYSSSGKLLTAITYETPFKLPFKISLNDQGNEIERVGKLEEQTVKITRKGASISMAVKGRRKPSTCMALATDSQNRIYITTQKRLLTEEERKGGRIHTRGERIVRSDMNLEVLENKDLIRLLVFSPEGKIIAQAKITALFPQLYINGDRIFLIDGTYNQQIQEYKMIFKKEKI